MTDNIPMTIVKVSVVFERGCLYASSEDEPGLNLSNTDPDILAKDILRAIVILYKKNRNMDVIAKFAADRDTFEENIKLTGVNEGNLP